MILLLYFSILHNLFFSGIDINNRRLEPNFASLAYLSLQKWRRLSNQATISNLIKILSKLDLAKYIRSVSKQQKIS